MPSKITECEKDNKELVCFSEVLNRTSGTQSVQYRVKSVITSASDKVTVSYRNLVIDVENTQEIDYQPIGYDDAVEAGRGFSIRTGWTKQHTVECKQPGGKTMECTKNRTHIISMVKG